MMRWLLHYTSAATIVRLVTANAFNYILTSAILERLGSSRDPHMILPAWILVALVGFRVYLRA
jgi:hypothetical protein